MSVQWSRYLNFTREKFTCRCGRGRNKMKKVTDLRQRNPGYVPIC